MAAEVREWSPGLRDISTHNSHSIFFLQFTRPYSPARAHSSTMVHVATSRHVASRQIRAHKTE